jgi:hypothetical protein
LEIGLHRHDEVWYRVEPRLLLPDEDAERHPPAAAEILVQFDLDQLGTKAAYDDAYGRLLTDSLFGPKELKTFFAQARAQLAQDPPVPLRLRLYVGSSAPELHNLRWETLRDPQRPDVLLALDENVLLSRYLSSSHWRSVRVQARTDLKALVVVANPDDLAEYDLAEVDVPRELDLAREGLGESPIDALCRCDDPRCDDLKVNVLGRPTLLEILDRLRSGYDILYLVAHGKLHNQVPLVWLEGEAGEADVVKPDGPDGLVTQMALLTQLPRLVVLASCQSAGMAVEWASKDGGALAALGPQLAEAGVPAVVAMQGDVTMDTVKRFTPRFFEVLQEGGQIDGAMAVARRSVRGAGRDDWWVPVLFLRLKSGRLFDASVPLPVMQAPHLPTKYVERQSELDRLRAELLPPTSSARAILHGMAAVGKSVLAAAFAHDRKVQKAFPDGVLWVTLGTEPDLRQCLERWGHGLDDPLLDSRPYDSAESANARLQKLLQDKACLLVVDDAWHEKHVKHFQVGGPGCLLLITSRKADVLRDTPAIRLEEMRAEEALKLMARWAEGISDADQSTAAWLASQVGHLPLALELLAARAKPPAGSWAKVRQQWITQEQAAVKRRRRPTKKEDSLLLSLELSLEGLNEPDQELYLNLGVFPEDTPFPVSAAGALWRCDAFDPEEFLIDLAGQALLTPRVVDGEQWYTFHDVQRAFVVDRLGEAGSQAAHAALVAGYSARCGGVWAELEPDSYVHNNLAWHMAEARLYNKLCELVLDEAWRRSQREAHRDTQATLDDLQRALKLALDRDEIVTALDCVATYRETAHTTSIIDALYAALKEGDLHKALSLAPVKGPVEDWGRVLYLYLAWEAALAGERRLSRKAVGDAEQWRLVQAKKLCHALRVRTAFALAGGDPEGARTELDRLGRDADTNTTLQVYAPGTPMSDDEVWEILDEIKKQMQSLGPEEKPGDEAAIRDVRLIASQLAGLAASSTNRELVERLLDIVEQIPYPRYRDVVLIAAGSTACLRVSDDSWLRRTLQSIIHTGLDREGVVFTFDLPFQLLEAAREQGLPEAEQGSLPTYCHTALSHPDPWGWGFRLRALSARAGSLYRRQGRENEARSALDDAEEVHFRYAGYGALHMLALADRWRELGDPARGLGLIDRAEKQASSVGNKRFRKDRIRLVREFRSWWIEEAMDFETTQEKLRQIPDTDTRLVIRQHLSARWASAAEGPTWEWLKALLPEVLAYGTGSFRDAILGRLFGVYLATRPMTDDDLARAITICERPEMLSKPWVVGDPEQKS